MLLYTPVVIVLRTTSFNMEFCPPYVSYGLSLEYSTRTLIMMATKPQGHNATKIEQRILECQLHFCSGSLVLCFPNGLAHIPLFPCVCF
jgi:hypothetical protein